MEIFPESATSVMLDTNNDRHYSIVVNPLYDSDDSVTLLNKRNLEFAVMFFGERWCCGINGVDLHYGTRLGIVPSFSDWGIVSTVVNNLFQRLEDMYGMSMAQLSHGLLDYLVPPEDAATYHGVWE